MRPTMVDLIATVAELIADPAYCVFTREAIQTALDRHRRRVRYLPLTADPSISGNATQYLAYTAPCRDWEAGAVLVDSAYTALTPATTDLTEGRWTFAASTPPPVLLSGTTYDVYAAAAALCDQRAALTAEDFDFSADGLTAARNQKTINWAARATLYRAQRRVWAG